MDKTMKLGLLFVIVIFILGIAFSCAEKEEVVEKPIEKEDPQVVIIEQEKTPEVIVVPQKEIEIVEVPVEEEDKEITVQEEDPVINHYPVAFESPNWEKVKANGVLVAERYAIKRNPKASFNTGSQVTTNAQVEGRYKGTHLLSIKSVDTKNGSISFAQLKPLFDLNKTTETLDLSTSQWEVVTAKLDGSEF